MSTAAAAPSTNDSTSRPGVRFCPSTVARSAAWKTTSAVASLNSPSACRTVSSRRGIRTRPATASTATGSGGATMAPSATAAVSPIPGTSSHTAPATAAIVATTNATASSRMLRQRARNTDHDVRCAVA